MDNFLLAAIPEPFVILGHRLLPLSIGRLLYLERFECDPVVTLDQLIRAVIICSRPLPEVIPAFYDVALEQQLRKWSDKIGQFDPAEKIALFRDYIQEGLTRGPIVLEEDAGAASADAPWLQHLTVTLCAKLHYSRGEVFEMPYSLAMWDYYTHWENEGRANILGDRRRSMHDLANAMHAATTAALNGSTSESQPEAPCPI